MPTPTATVNALPNENSGAAQAKDAHYAQAAEDDAAVSCSGAGDDGQVIISNLHGLTVTPHFSPSIAAIWKHPLFGSGGFYPGAGGLSLFQADIDGSITLNMGISVSAAATCTLALPSYKAVVDAGDLGAVLIDIGPSFTFNVTGAVDERASVTLTCGAEYRWDNGQESRGDYCSKAYQPLALQTYSGIDATLSGALNASVTLDDLVGIKGSIDASLHAGYHPEAQPVAELDAEADFDLTGCLACFWKGSPAQVTIAHGTVFKKTLATYSTAPPSPGGEAGGAGSGGDGGSGANGTPPKALIAAGSEHSCALWAGGAVLCWGGGGEGQLGDGATAGSLTPVQVAGISDATNVTAGADHTCVVLSSGGVMCWGWNGHGQLGNGTTTSSSIPVAVSSVTSATAVVAGADHSCALLTTGHVACWGDNSLGQLGDGTMSGSATCTDNYGEGNYCVTTPVTVSGITNAVAIAAGASHTCAVLATGQVECWGSGDEGQLGSYEYSAATPQVVGGITNATGVTAGGDHTCATLSDGSADCWGANAYGQLGNGGTSASAIPAAVQAPAAVTAAAAGGLFDCQIYPAGGCTEEGHTCAILSGGGLDCWGFNWDGELGDGTTSSSSTPVAVDGLASVAEVVAGGQHVCVLTSGGEIACWGSNSYGQLGNGTSSGSLTPVAVAGFG